jgi:hypothetical protein
MIMISSLILSADPLSLARLYTGTMHKKLLNDSSNVSVYAVNYLTLLAKYNVDYPAVLVLDVL